jgi:hypothetical protein
MKGGAYMKGVDFAGAKLTRPIAQALVDEGVQFVGRYLWGGWKELTLEEVVIAKEYGIYIMSIAQGGKGDLLDGYAAGVRLGTKAFLAAQAKGQPFGSALFFAVDFDTTTQSELNSIGETLRGVRAALNGNYLVGVYGEAQVVDFTAKNGFSQVEFQTYAWSGGKLSEYADIYQYQNDVSFIGIQVDHNKSFGGEGFWCGPAVPENQGEVVIEMEKNDADQLVNILGQLWTLDVRNVEGQPMTREEYHRLANVCRKLSGQPEQG